MVLRGRKKPRYKGPFQDIDQFKGFLMREAYYEIRSQLRRRNRELAFELMGPSWTGWVPGLIEYPKSFNFNYPLAV